MIPYSLFKFMDKRLRAILLVGISLATATSLTAPNPASANLLTDGVWSGITCNLPSAKPCTFCDGVHFILNIVNLLFIIAAPIAAAMIIWAGFRLMIFAYSPDAKKKSWEIIRLAVFGFILTLASWAIIAEIMHILVGDPTFAAWKWNEVAC